MALVTCLGTPGSGMSHISPVHVPLDNSTVVNKRGRKPSSDSLVFKTVGLTPDQWRWLELWFPSSSPTSQLRELIARALKFCLPAPARFR